MNIESENQKTITRDVLSKVVRRECGITLKRASELVDQTLDAITGSLVGGNNVAIRRFGVFTRRHKNERIGRNPKTMEPAAISARWVITFKSSSVLKKRIAETRKYLK